MSCPPVVCLSSVTLLRSRQTIELFGNSFTSPNIAQALGQCIKFWANIRRGSRGSSKLDTRVYKKLAFIDQYLALFRNGTRYGHSYNGRR